MMKKFVGVCLLCAALSGCDDPAARQAAAMLEMRHSMERLKWLAGAGILVALAVGIGIGSRPRR